MKDLYFFEDNLESSSKKLCSYLISRFFVLFALKNANKPSFRFSVARLVVEYLSDMTSPCSVYLNLFFIVPLGCDRIEL